MCNLNIVIKTKDMNVAGFMQSVSSVSFEGNTDGDGFWCSNNDVLVKREKSKVDMSMYSKELNKSNFIISHQRLATHGLNPEMVQPFQNSEFVFAHNGVMSSMYDVSNPHISDSYGFFNKFMDELEQRRTLSRDEQISQSIKALLDNMVGSYSIIIYDKVLKCAYYFKNMSTTIHGWACDGMIYLTTNRNNESYVGDLINPEKQELKIKELDIHKIWIEGKKIKTRAIGTITPYTYVVPTFNANSNDYGQYDEGRWISHVPNPTTKQTKLVEEIHVDINDPLSDANNVNLYGKDRVLCENCNAYKAKVHNCIFGLALCRCCLRQMVEDAELTGYEDNVVIENVK